MEIIRRSGSLVVLKTLDGKYWLTRRKKIRRDSRRQKKRGKCGVIRIPILEIKESELHLFTFMKKRKNK